MCTRVCVYLRMNGLTNEARTAFFLGLFDFMYHLRRQPPAYEKEKVQHRKRVNEKKNGEKGPFWVSNELSEDANDEWMTVKTCWKSRQTGRTRDEKLTKSKTRLIFWTKRFRLSSNWFPAGLLFLIFFFLTSHQWEKLDCKKENTVCVCVCGCV